MHFERIADKKRSDYITSVLRKFVAPGSTVLDVGCGNGIISKAVAEAGYFVDAIDVSSKTIEAAQLSNPHSNIRYMVVAADELVPVPGKYAGIICSEVLEHLREPSELLKILHQSLSEQGILVVTVPNGKGPRELLVTRPVQYLQRADNPITKLVFGMKKKMGYTGVTVQSSADDLAHIQFFTPRTLRKLAESNGFRIESFASTNFVEQVFPVSLLARRSFTLQRFDCWLADRLPLKFTSGFMSVWKKR